MCDIVRGRDSSGLLYDCVYALNANIVQFERLELSPYVMET